MQTADEAAKPVEVAAEMYRHTIEYKSAADCLSGKLADFGWSANILEILALEILLKCLFRLDKGRPAKGYRHNYLKLWGDISADAREEILATARARAPGHADLGLLGKALLAAENLFLRGRYSYELLEERSVEDHRKLGEAWVESGASLEDADFAHYHWEIVSLYEGLRKWVEDHLGSR